MAEEYKVDANVSPDFKETLGNLINQIEILSLDKAQADIDNSALQSKLKTAVDAFTEYAGHQPDCATEKDGFPTTEPCSCGLLDTYKQLK